MYADDDRKMVFYQFPIGPLTSAQHAIFLYDGKFGKDGTKGCTCCNGAIYVVHVQRRWDYKKFPIIANPSKSVPGKDNITEANLAGDAEFIKAQTAWDMLRNEPLYMKATKKAYQRRKKIYLEARWLQRHAVTIRNNHPDSKQFDELDGDEPSGPVTNSKRDKRLYKLSFDMSLTWGDIAAEGNKEFPGEQLDEKSAPVAAKRYARNLGLKPVPKRKAGRKPQNKSE
jgi:hypothetical protein